LGENNSFNLKNAGSKFFIKCRYKSTITKKHPGTRAGMFDVLLRVQQQLGTAG